MKATKLQAMMLGAVALSIVNDSTESMLGFPDNTEKRVSSVRGRRKSQLTNKQQKARKRSKNARKARHKNR